MYIKVKSYKLELLGKLVVQYGIKIWFDKSCVGATFPQFACLFPHLFLLSPNLQFVYLSTYEYRAAHERGC